MKMLKQRLRHGTVEYRIFVSVLAYRVETISISFVRWYTTGLLRLISFFPNQFLLLRVGLFPSNLD